jgi:hypothetical protein
MPRVKAGEEPEGKYARLQSKLSYEYRRFGAKATGADYEELARRNLGGFRAHARELCGDDVIGGLRLRGGVEGAARPVEEDEGRTPSASRDCFAVLVALRLLRTRLCVLKTRALSFFPSLPAKVALLGNTPSPTLPNSSGHKHVHRIAGLPGVPPNNLRIP